MNEKDLEGNASCISKASQDDTEIILDMMEQFYRIDNYPFDRAKSEQVMAELFGNPACGEIWLLKVNALIAGYVVIACGFSFEYGGRDGFIDEVFIKDAYQGRGLGRKLMEFAISRAKEMGIKTLHLEVEKHNEVGHRLYRKLGFEGKGRNLLSKRLDDIVSSDKSQK